jgi:transcriptional regulator with PAS, ATPase and Fis domain
MREIRMKIEHAAQDNFPVLIEGESGTGKEVIGHFLHAHSARREGPFIRVNCGAVPARLLEAELFGHEVGASGNVRETKNGSFGMASGGTIFLDEVGDLDLMLQGKVHRTLATGHYGRQNGGEELTMNARLVCASSRELEPGEGIDEGLLRCFVHRVWLKPLRERKQDIPQISEYLVEKLARNFGRPAPQLSGYVLKAFQQWNWPGNIRELENWIARIVIFGTEEVIGLEFRRQLGVITDVSTKVHRATHSKLDRARRMRRHS